MMADGFNEKLSIRESAKSLKKYGSTSNHTIRNETLIKHAVLSGDTLQGIALKYGVTTEQIRRANRLWASDSLFLREHLVIPVTADSPYSPSENHNRVNEHTSQSQSFNAHDEEDEKTINDFLNKIDTSIAVTKNEVKKCQGNSDFLSGLDYGGHEKRKPAVSRMRQTVNNNTSPGGGGAPQAVVMTQGKIVRTSLQRLAQQQDEMFEL